MRDTWEDYFIDITKVVAQRSTCLSRKVGAIIVKDKRIIATGYNGSPSGFANCCDKGYCIRKDSPSGSNLNNCYAIHAEQNALLQCAKYGISCEGATLYVTNYPCATCMKLIVNSGIKEVIFIEDYNDILAKEIAFKSKNIIIRQYIKGE